MKQYDYYNIVFKGEVLTFEEWFRSCELRDLLYGIAIGSMRKSMIEREGERLLGRYLSGGETRLIHNLRESLWVECPDPHNGGDIRKVYQKCDIDVEPTIEPLITVESLRLGLMALNHDDSFEDNQGYHLSVGHTGMRRCLIDMLERQAVEELLIYMGEGMALMDESAVNDLQHDGWSHTHVGDDSLLYAAIDTQKGALVYV